MKSGVLHALCAAAVALSVAVAARPAAADDQAPVIKSKRYKHRAQITGESYPSPESYRSSKSSGQFPDSCAYDRAAGRCMIDLGYGRCMECSSGPFK